MLPLAQALESAGFALYAAPILAMTAWLSLSIDQPLGPGLKRFLTLGPFLGIVLGACILGALGGIWLEHGEFVWTFGTDQGRITAIQQTVFFLVWVSNIKLEIWTLDGARAALKGPGGPEALRAAAVTLRRHLWIHSLGLLGLIALSCS